MLRRLLGEDGPCPPFDPNRNRYDLSTFVGRLQHFREVTDPVMLLTSDAELQRCQELLRRHGRGEAAGASDEQLWDAKRVVDAMVHPTTHEKMLLPGRVSAIVPVYTVPTVGMLASTSPAATVFWQWVNQSVNVLTNYTNRSGATVDWAQIAQAYGLAVAVSCSIAIGARKLVQSGPPAVKRLGLAVPYAAVVTAGGANTAFTRLPEMRAGVPVVAPDGTPLGVSRAAATSAVVNTVLSRNLLLPIAPMLLPPLAMLALRSAMPLGPIAAVAAETGLVAGCLYGALPVAIAVFPQEMTIPVSSLEPEFAGRRDSAGRPVEVVRCNKGL